MLGGFLTTIRVFTDEEEIQAGDKLFFKDGKAIKEEYDSRRSNSKA